MKEGNLDEAERLFRQALDVKRNANPDDKAGYARSE